MKLKPRADERILIAQMGKAAKTPEQAREALVAMSKMLIGDDKIKCQQSAQTLGDQEVLKVCHAFAKTLLLNLGPKKPWWKFW